MFTQFSHYLDRGSELNVVRFKILSAFNALKKPNVYTISKVHCVLPGSTSPAQRIIRDDFLNGYSQCRNFINRIAYLYDGDNVLL